MNEVKSPKKPLLYYYFVVMLLVMLFNFIAMPWISEHQIKDVDYNTFVTMTEQGEVGRVEIQEQSNRILFTSSDEKTVYKTAMVPDDGLVQRLLDAGVSTTGEEIEQTSTLVSILAWVLPIIIFVALGQYTLIFISARRTFNSSAAASSARTASFGRYLRHCASNNSTLRSAVSAATRSPSSSATDSVCRPMEPVEPKIVIVFVIPASPAETASHTRRAKGTASNRTGRVRRRGSGKCGCSP